MNRDAESAVAAVDRYAAALRGETLRVCAGDATIHDLVTVQRSALRELWRALGVDPGGESAD